MIRPEVGTGTSTDWTTHVYVFTHAYDLEGRLTETGYPAPIAPKKPTGAPADPIRYHYAPVSGALDTITDFRGTTSRYTFRYDAAGRAVQTTRGGCTSTPNLPHFMNTQIPAPGCSQVVASPPDSLGVCIRESGRGPSRAPSSLSR